MHNAIRQAVIKFEQDFMGRGPTDVRAFIIRDMVVVRLRGVLTQAERQLAKSADGIEMIKRMRQNLIEQGKDKLCGEISAITHANVTGLFTDTETQLGERVMVSTLECRHSIVPLPLDGSATVKPQAGHVHYVCI